MRLIKCLAVAGATAGVALMMAAPADAQRTSTAQDQRSPTTAPLDPGRPYVRPVAADTRDHRSNAGNSSTTVKPSDQKRSGGTCLTPTIRGACLGIPKEPFGRMDNAAPTHRDRRVIDHRVGSASDKPYSSTSSKPPPPGSRKVQ